MISDPPMPLDEALAQNDDGRFGALIAPLLFDRLGLSVGDSLLLGNAELTVTGTLEQEPDSLSEGFSLAPRICV